MNGREVYIYEALRTPRGRAGKGSLAEVAPIELVAALLRELGKRGIDDENIDDLVLGCVTQVGEQGANLAKTAALYAGLADRVPGMTLNRFCPSGLDAVAAAAMQVACGVSELVCAGGVESMSRAPMGSDKGPWVADAKVSQQTGFLPMPLAADLFASLHDISREELDAYAARSQTRAATRAAMASRSLVPVAGLAVDELIRADTTVESLAALPPMLSADAIAPFAERVSRRLEPSALRFSHTRGTSPGVVDGASLLVLGSAEAGKRAGVSPLARLRAAATVGSDPIEMLGGNPPAIRRALGQAGIGIGEVEQFEINESFACVPVHAARVLEIDEARLNPSGGAIAKGHPLGATGGILLCALLEGLSAGALGVASICGGAGVATCLVIERC